MKKRIKTLLNFCLIINVFLALNSNVFAQNESLFANSKLNIVKVDTLGYNKTFLPSKIRNNYPYHINNSKDIKALYKEAQTNKDGYLIYKLSILEFESVFTYGNLSPYKMLFEAWNIAINDGDPMLAIYIMAQELRFNLFGREQRIKCYKQIDSLAVAQKNAIPLYEIANYCEGLAVDDPDLQNLRVKASSIENPTKISKEEFMVFWEKFKEFVKNKDTSKIQDFVNSSIDVQILDFGDVLEEYSKNIIEISDEFLKPTQSPKLIPELTPSMQEVSLGNPVKHGSGEKGQYYWVINSEFKNPETGYVYEIGKSGEVSYRTIYFFKKFDGKIKLYKVINENM
ncbi:MAG: hypothetical protein JXR58_07535 [Bacteroidales bacterium]|nr:hypothetical protein [Bacteroidales bacterium]